MQTVAVIFGGRSAEHDVSIVTAIASIIKPLELSKKYRVEAVYVAKDGRWFWDDKLKDITLFTSGSIDRLLVRSQPAGVQFDGGLTLVKSGGLTGRTQRCRVDVVFPSMHGTYGEDGSLMGLLDMAGVPYVGCGLEASVLAMNKLLAKQVAVAAGVPSNTFVGLQRSEFASDQAMTAVVKRVTAALRYPLFVKPVHLGSSIAISKVGNDRELANALEVAAKYDDTIIVEEAVPNLVEVTLPIIGNQELTPALLEQPLVTAGDFFDFRTKYLSGGKKGGKLGGKTGARTGANGKAAGATQGSQGYSQIPADLPAALSRKAEQIGLDVYRALGCSGIARVDMLIDRQKGAVYFNEVNPLPGSLYVHNWRQKGISNVELVTRLVELAQARHAARQSLSTVFTTNFLQQF